jgi:hypothetical protein
MQEEVREEVRVASPEPAVGGVHVAHVGRRNAQFRNRFVHGFVHETRRDGLRRGRRFGPGMNACRPFAEVNVVTRDHARCQRRHAGVSIHAPTTRDYRDACRMAHNPATEGRNSATPYEGHAPLLHTL